MDFSKLKNKGFGEILLKTNIEDLQHPEIFKMWKENVSDNIPVSFLIGNLVEMNKFAVCCAKLFTLNKYTCEAITTLHLEDNYFGVSFFIVLKDGFALTNKTKTHFKRMITKSITNGMPLMALFISDADIENILEKPFLKSIDGSYLCYNVGVAENSGGVL